MTLPSANKTSGWSLSFDAGRWVVDLLALSIGGVLVASSIFHISNPLEFLHSILNYRIVGIDLAIALAGLLPYAQLAVGVYLILGWFQPVAAWLASALLAIYLVAQSWALYQGLDISCGCFGAYSDKVSWSSAGKVGGLWGMALLVAYCKSRDWQKPERGFWGWLSVGPRVQV